MDNNKKYRQRCGRLGGIYEWNANPGDRYPYNGWYVDDSGIKHPCSFDNNLKFHANKKEDPSDLIEITPYDGIAIDTPGWAVENNGFQVERYFAGVDDLGKPLVWWDGRTSWTSDVKYQCENFIPKGTDE